MLLAEDRKAASGRVVEAWVQLDIPSAFAQMGVDLFARARAQKVEAHEATAQLINRNMHAERTAHAAISNDADTGFGMSRSILMLEQSAVRWQVFDLHTLASILVGFLTGSCLQIRWFRQQYMSRLVGRSDYALIE